MSLTPRKFFIGRLIGLGMVLILVGIFFAFQALNTYIYNEKQAIGNADYRAIAYTLNGARVTLQDNQGPTRFFGNEVYIDLNNDNRDDIVFVLTHNPGGSGTFYYVVAAITTTNGYVGSEGYLLGDRIAPQSTSVDTSTGQPMIMVAFADRASGEPMTAQPSVGKVAQLLFDQAAMRFNVMLRPYRTALSGEYVCLPHKDTTGPQAEECAYGLKTDDGYYYAIDFALMSQEQQPLATGQRITANGLVTPLEWLSTNHWQRYPIEGIFSVTDSVKIIE